LANQRAARRGILYTGGEEERTRVQKVTNRQKNKKQKLTFEAINNPCRGKLKKQGDGQKKKTRDATTGGRGYARMTRVGPVSA